MNFDRDSEDAAIRVLLADADPLARRMIRDALQRDAIVIVAEATNGREVIELAGFYRPDAVLMDATLPVVAGVEATRAIHDRAPDTCVVLMAAGPDDSVGLHALRAGAVGYLSKDVDPAVLPRVLRGTIEGEAAISRRLARTLIESYRRAPLGGSGFRPAARTSRIANGRSST